MLFDGRFIGRVGGLFREAATADPGNPVDDRGSAAVDLRDSSADQGGSAGDQDHPTGDQPDRAAVYRGGAAV